MAKTVWVGTSWKMNKVLADALAYADGLKAADAKRHERVRRFIVPSFTVLREVKARLAGTSVMVGAQNMHWEEGGAWTGEVSPHGERHPRPVRWTPSSRRISGHPGMPMGMADVATVLFTKVLKFDPAAALARPRPLHPVGRPRLDAAVLAAPPDRGEDMTMDSCKPVPPAGLARPPAIRNMAMPGIETTTGPLGQGIATAVGMAMAERKLAARFGADLIRPLYLCDRR
jgi:hypothetical protein